MIKFSSHSQLTWTFINYFLITSWITLLSGTDSPASIASKDAAILAFQRKMKFSKVKFSNGDCFYYTSLTLLKNIFLPIIIIFKQYIRSMFGCLWNLWSHFYLYDCWRVYLFVAWSCSYMVSCSQPYLSELYYNYVSCPISVTVGWQVALTTPRTGRRSVAGNFPSKTGTYLHLGRVRKWRWIIFPTDKIRSTDP